jgi:hypothetical protein
MVLRTLTKDIVFAFLSIAEIVQKLSKREKEGYFRASKCHSYKRTIRVRMPLYNLFICLLSVNVFDKPTQKINMHAYVAMLIYTNETGFLSSFLSNKRLS